MKCPKCDYLGFETGDRCKNCGYDFSLAIAAVPQEPDLPLRDPEPLHRDADSWLNQLEARLDTVRPVADLPAPSQDGPLAPKPAVVPPIIREIAPRNTPALPLFHPGAADWDEPLIKLPSAPRPPLSVRKTPDKPRLRTVPAPVRQTVQEPDPVLSFADEPLTVSPPRSTRTPPVLSVPVVGAETSGPLRRMIAALVDYSILVSIDAIVIYFTFQIAGLPFAEWRSIPLVPLVLFLLMVKAAYFSVFTMVGGQTVGKMATGIRVVTENDRAVEPSQAVQRALAALASVATAGIAFAPVLFSGDRRALHDRVAGTRVVGPVHE